jgi:purine-nucleoside phosphorylase
MQQILTKINEANNYIKNIIGENHQVGVVLGSGLGVFANQISNPIRIKYQDIPHFHQTTVAGHSGELISGTIGEKKVIVLSGRFHFYEGHDLGTVTLPIRVLHKLGVKKLILTNASGGINPHYKPGNLVYIKDHINLTGNNPLIGPNLNEYGERFPDMTETYDKKLIEKLKETADHLGIHITGGIYGGVLGPSYETPAEIKMLKIIGADMVGMSTVPEAIVAAHMQMRVCAISCITNMASGISESKLSHDDVKIVAEKTHKVFCQLLESFIKSLK